MTRMQRHAIGRPWRIVFAPPPADHRWVVTRARRTWWVQLTVDTGCAIETEFHGRNPWHVSVSLRAPGAPAPRPTATWTKQDRGIAGSIALDTLRGVGEVVADPRSPGNDFIQTRDALHLFRALTQDEMELMKILTHQ